MVQLQSIVNADLELIARWMGTEENYQWLDFGAGSQPLSLLALKVMIQRDNHLLRIFADERGVPLGLVGFSNVNRVFKTALLWYVLGERSAAGKGFTTRAVSRLLAVGFGEVGLQAVHAWTVETNVASIRVLERNRFQLIGRQRQCHYLDGQAYDRLWFDLLASEFVELEP